jgi:3-hydroxyacyl-CoA dehydrogenase / 3-hydroxy-2-methylbutyryl-CoA dehydrogenase
MEVAGCVALVTGGASGLGEACVRDLLKAGAKIAIVDLNDEKGEAVASELGGKAIYLRVDVTNEQSVIKAIERVIRRFGTINIVVNCAGIPTPGKVLSKMGPLPLQDFTKVIQINLIGTFNVIRLAVERMVKNEPNEDGERGVIINTASLAAFEGQIGQPAYSASKAGVVGLTLPIARELAAHGIRCMTIAPGLFKTPMVESLPEAVQKSLGEMPPFPKRPGKPSEFAQLVRHIIENPMLNGEVIRIDAAMRMSAK